MCELSIKVPIQKKSGNLLYAPGKSIQTLIFEVLITISVFLKGFL